MYICIWVTGPCLYGMYSLGWMGSGMPEVNFVQCLVFSAVIVAVDPVAVSVKKFTLSMA